MKETLDILIRVCLFFLLGLILILSAILGDRFVDQPAKDKAELRQLQMKYYRTATTRDSVIIQRELRFLNR